jgi:hypothetical protein
MTPVVKIVSKVTDADSLNPGLTTYPFGSADKVNVELVTAIAFNGPRVPFPFVDASKYPLLVTVQWSNRAIDAIELE